MNLTDDSPSKNTRSKTKDGQIGEVTCGSKRALGFDDAQVEVKMVEDNGIIGWVSTTLLVVLELGVLSPACEAALLNATADDAAGGTVANGESRDGMRSRLKMEARQQR